MKPISRIFNFTAASSLLVMLVGCASAGHSNHSHDEAAYANMDMQAMCEMHKKMMSGRTPEEHHAMMGDHMKSMSADMKKRMQAVHEQCK